MAPCSTLNRRKAGPIESRRSRQGRGIVEVIWSPACHGRGFDDGRDVAMRREHDAERFDAPGFEKLAAKARAVGVECVHPSV